MGRQTKNFRQSQKSISGTQGARNFSQQNRNAWHQRFINFVTTRGGGKNHGTS